MWAALCASFSMRVLTLPASHPPHALQVHCALTSDVTCSLMTCQASASFKCTCTASSCLLAVIRGRQVQHSKLSC